MFPHSFSPCAGTFFLGVFLVKYRIEFLIAFPFLALMFAWYLAIGLRPASPVQAPEKLYQEVGYVAYVAGICVLIAILLVVDFPVLQFLMDPVAF